MSLSYGNAGTLVTGSAPRPYLTVVPSGRTLEDDLARAAARRRPYLQPLPPKLVIVPKPRPKPAPRPKVKRRTPQLQPRQDWVVLYAQGLTVNQIAADHGATPLTVRRHLTRAGVTLRNDRLGYWKRRGGKPGRPQHHYTPADLAAAVAAYRAGASVAAVAAQLHVRHASARAALEGAGVTIRPTGTRPLRRCSECDRPHYGRGLCHPHYDQARKAAQ